MNRDPTRFLRRHAIDVVLMAIPAAGALACWWFRLPTWMLIGCLLLLLVALVSFLGDLGVFGGSDRE